MNQEYSKMEKDFKGSNVLITGGNGFIGSNIAHRLVSLGANVTLFSIDFNENFRNIKEIYNKVETIEGDIRDEKKVNEIVKSKHHIFHLVGQTDHVLSMEQPKLDVDINCNGTLNILEACKNFNRDPNIVFSGTVTEAGSVNNIPANEDIKDLPLSIYDANKLVCEKYMQIYNKAFGLKTTTLRFSNVFGERQNINSARRGILNHMIGRALLGEVITIYGKGDFIRDYCYIQNYVDACLIAATSKKTKGEFYVIGSGKGLTFKDMVYKINEKTKELTGKSTEIKHIPFPENEKRIDAGDFIADYSKFKKATGWFPRVSFEEGLKKTILFYNSIK